VAPILLAIIAKVLVRLDTCEQNECHAPFLSNYSITNKLTRACECIIVLGLYCRLEIILKQVHNIKSY